MKKVLVTGADGFIGSHLVQLLLSEGCDVKAFVFYNSFNSWGWLDHSPKKIKKNLDVFPGDIRDPHGVKEAMKGCDVCVNFAAETHVDRSLGDASSFVLTDVYGTYILLEAAKQSGVRRFIIQLMGQILSGKM